MTGIKFHSVHVPGMQFSFAIHLFMGAVDFKAPLLSQAQQLKLLHLVIFAVKSYGFLT